ncbi:MAG: HNH endonuclease [Rhodocyclaceae bacterium]|nr:HNH endonuclease [Rhodocyclaceae bacterium]
MDAGQTHRHRGRSSFSRFVLCLGILAAAGLDFGRVWAAPRDPAQVRAFRAEHPCPSTGLKRGACPGWDVDHIVPLCAGGADHPSNLQWLSKDDHKWKTFVDVRECRKAKQQPTTHK